MENDTYKIHYIENRLTRFVNQIGLIGMCEADKSLSRISNRI